jgi:dihydrolipoyl dehydrogenase
MDQTFDLAVIGGGPGGYVAAIRAAQLGLKAACIEKDTTLGGTCLNVGCIPSKALLDSTEFLSRIRDNAAVHGIGVGEVAMDVAQMMRRKEQVVAGLTKGIDYLFRKNGVAWIRGAGRLVEPDRVEVIDSEGTRHTVVARHLVIATGSTPAALPGIAFDEQRVLSSTGALALEEVPGHLIVVGGGVIGMELGSVWLRLGARVTVMELTPSILPGTDAEIVAAAEPIFRRQGFTLRSGVRVTAVEPHDTGVRVTLDGGETLEGDRVLIAVGRRPFTEGLGAHEIGLRLDPRGAIQVDRRYHTGVGAIYAAGDAIGGAMLAHEAMEEGVAAVECAVGLAGHVNYDAIANVVYTHPEVASVGETEEQARAGGRELRIGRFPFSANGRARALDDSEGLVKVVADAATNRLLGIHILGPRASALIAEASLALDFQASAEDIGLSVHAHPTLPEALKEACLGALGRAIHF